MATILCASWGAAVLACCSHVPYPSWHRIARKAAAPSPNTWAPSPSQRSSRSLLALMSVRALSLPDTSLYRRKPCHTAGFPFAKETISGVCSHRRLSAIIRANRLFLNLRHVAQRACKWNPPLCARWCQNIADLIGTVHIYDTVSGKDPPLCVFWGDRTWAQIL